VGGQVLDIQTEQVGACTICRPVGDLDAFSVTRLGQALAAMASAPQLIIDLVEVPLMDSAGLGALMSGIRGVRELGGEVAVACPRATLNRVLHASSLESPSCTPRRRSASSGMTALAR
jgi:anti-sigma B factor antagonist